MAPGMLPPLADDPAVTSVLRAAAAGDADALFQQATWHLAGTPLTRDLAAARRALRLAAVQGHLEATMMEIALTANGSGGPCDWAAARSSLAHAASFDPAAHRMSTLLNRMRLDDAGAPDSLPVAEPLSSDGLIRRVRGCLSADECVHVGASIADLLRPATVADPRTGRNIPNPIRTSDAAVLPPTREDLVLRAINLRIAAISGTRVDQGEALTVLRYQPGQQFRLHSDALPQTRNQRVRTVLIYLNDGYEGGETTFPDHGLTIAPRTGDAIVFDNTDAQGRPNIAMRHTGEPVRRGVKWLATRWIRARPFDVWTGPESV